ncbi:MAG: biopolymer transporter ExbD [Chromatiales bacterium]|nr:biopolymer transporter ExbD [Chromatiales bacterium]
MQRSRRAVRMDQHHKRRTTGGLNMVSLMDIFTILVFFLLVSAGDVDNLPNPRDLTLPESVATEAARETVVVTVTSSEILVQGRAVARLDEVLARDELVIPELRDALRAQTDRLLRQASAADVSRREVTIMGDRELPYSLLKQVMASCTAAEYGQISLAVMQRGEARSAGAGVTSPAG